MTNLAFIIAIAIALPCLILLAFLVLLFLHLNLTKLRNWLKFSWYMLRRAILHPRLPIIYYHCTACGVSLSPFSEQCPLCHALLGNSPKSRSGSPVPWWGCVGVIIIGVATWVLSACLEISSLAEVGRVLVYFPLGHLFGISIKS